MSAAQPAHDDDATTEREARAGLLRGVTVAAVLEFLFLLAFGALMGAVTVLSLLWSV